MKSKYSDRLGRWAWASAAVVVMSYGGTVSAGVAPSEMALSQARESYQHDTLREKQRPTTGDQELATTNGVDRGTNSVLRCWQHGRLIFEEKNWRPSRASAGLSGPILRSSDARFDSLQLSEFGNETFCYLKSREGNH